MNQTLLDIIGYVWVAAAIGLILWLKVLSPRPLVHSPPRHSTLSVIHLAGVILLYIGAMIMAQTLYVAIFPHSPPAVAATASTMSQTAPATTPADDSLRIAQLQIIGSFAQLIPTALILLLAATNVRGGFKGWGLGISQIPGALWRGALAFFIIMPLMYGLQTLVLFVLEHIGRAPAPPHEVLQLMQKEAIPAYIKVLLSITAAVIAPFAEEIFFRGFLQTIFIQRTAFIIGAGDNSNEFRKPSATRRWTVILVVAAFFASIHYNFSDPNPEQLLLLFLLGTALGYIYERTGNLWASITLHALFNGSVLLLLRLTGS